MPSILCCKQCGHVLLEDKHIPSGEEWYKTLYTDLNGKCPKCGRQLPEPRLVFQDMIIEVRPAPK